MTIPWQLRVYDRQALVHTEEVAGPLELGRQDEGETGPFSDRPAGSGRRLIIANREERSISRHHVLLEPLDPSRARVSNLSTSLSLRLGDGRELRPRASCEETLPVTFTLGRRTFFLQGEDTDQTPLQSLAASPAAPGTIIGSLPHMPGLQTMPDPDVRTKELVRCLAATMAVFQSAASSAEFLNRAAQAAVEITDIDSAGVLLPDEQGQWQTKAFFSGGGGAAESDWRASRHILEAVRREKKTFWQLPQLPARLDESLMGVRAVVAAPILDRHGQLLGALYGDRRMDGLSPGSGPITELEAMLIELLASGIAAGLARLEQEHAAVEARVRFEQFFTRELAHEFAEQPDLLKGRATEVTLLFVDIRGFSRICEQLGPGRSFDWVSDTLGELSDCVLRHQGVLVDYVGDELLAMWGAPGHQPDHAHLACRAALDMIGRLPALNERWRQAICEPIAVGIGINTGMARVGNVGSKFKFKYGPQGNTVNLASRVQGATKYLHASVLITGATSAKLGDDFPRRRLCSVRVVNIAQPVDLYELVPGDQADWSRRCLEYETALGDFEKHGYRAAARILGNLLGQFPNDGPALVLLSRALNALLDQGPPRDHVWELPGK
jgi:adenylate cyclase